MARLLTVLDRVPAVRGKRPLAGAVTSATTDLSRSRYRGFCNTMTWPATST